MAETAISYSDVEAFWPQGFPAALYAPEDCAKMKVLDVRRNDPIKVDKGDGNLEDAVIVGLRPNAVMVRFAGDQRPVHIAKRWVHVDAIKLVVG